MTSPCRGAKCKDNLYVRTTRLGTSYCFLTALAPLSKDNRYEDNVLCNQSSHYKDNSLYKHSATAGFFPSAPPRRESTSPKQESPKSYSQDRPASQGDCHSQCGLCVLPEMHWQASADRPSHLLSLLERGCHCIGYHLHLILSMCTLTAVCCGRFLWQCSL